MAGPPTERQRRVSKVILPLSSSHLAQNNWQESSCAPLRGGGGGGGGGGREKKEERKKSKRHREKGESIKHPVITGSN